MLLMQKSKRVKNIISKQIRALCAGVTPKVNMVAQSAYHLTNSSTVPFLLVYRLSFCSAIYPFSCRLNWAQCGITQNHDGSISLHDL